MFASRIWSTVSRFLTSQEDQKARRRNGWPANASTPAVCAHISLRPVTYDLAFCTDYLLYGRIYIPTGRLDALYSTRLAPTLQGMVAAISDPRVPLSSEKSRSHGPSSNVMFSLQHDTGKVCTEYTWSAEDGMWGVRSLYNFGKIGTHADVSAEEAGHAPNGNGNGSGKGKVKRVDEEDAMEGGLKGRVSVGGEFYFSAKEKSAGGESGDPLPFCAYLTSYSFYRHPLHHSSRCYAPVFPSPIIIKCWTIMSQWTSISATHDDHRPVQPHARTHLWGIRRASVA